MLFNSYAFIFVFLPIALTGALWLGRREPRRAALWLAIASLAFYSMWDWRFTPLLIASVVFNYGAGRRIVRERAAGRTRALRWALIAAVAANLVVLGYFKYANFLLASAHQVFGVGAPALNVVLPLGISFFTFTQIAFLVDAHRGEVRQHGFVYYLMFVTYFPHLIAGPLYHHAQMMPQFARKAAYRIDLGNLGAGLTIFVLGLTKKVLLADGLAPYANAVFGAAGGGQLMLAEAWIGALAYTLQLYFDFSGYSDTAIGLALMMNMRLPLNFDSPYRATSIIDFWRRWHMTLSAFLRDYLYIPLGGNRRGSPRRYSNILATMLLGGLWHGAGWTYVAWGGLHGLYLLANHGWRDLKGRLGWKDGGAAARAAAAALTFLAVVVGWVFFRSPSFSCAWEMLRAMSGANGVSLPLEWWPRFAEAAARVPGVRVSFMGIAPVTAIAAPSAVAAIAGGLLLVWLFPNVRQMMAPFNPVWQDLAATSARRPSWPGWAAALAAWRLDRRHAVAAGVLLFMALMVMSKQRSEFLYFQF